MVTDNCVIGQKFELGIVNLEEQKLSHFSGGVEVCTLSKNSAFEFLIEQSWLEQMQLGHPDLMIMRQNENKYYLRF